MGPMPTFSCPVIPIERSTFENAEWIGQAAAVQCDVALFYDVRDLAAYKGKGKPFIHVGSPALDWVAAATVPPETTWIPCAEHVRRALVKQQLTAGQLPGWVVDAIWNGVRLEDYPHVSPRDTSVVTFGAVGRMYEPHKQFGMVIDAIAQIYAEHGLDGVKIDSKHIQLIGLFVGDGPNLGFYREKARDLRIAQKVTWIGAQPRGKMPSLYQQMDVFVAPGAEMEGDPVVLSEAIASGLPIVWRDAPAHRERLANRAGLRYSTTQECVDAMRVMLDLRVRSAQSVASFSLRGASAVGPMLASYRRLLRPYTGP